MERERREHQAIRLADGRLLGFAEYGDPAGTAVVLCHREVGSRLLGRALGPAALELGLRIVAPDRPGIGFSDHRPDGTIAGWPDDVVELTGELAVDRFSVVGVAGGAAYALACAARLGARISGVALASPALPVSMTEYPPGTPRLQRVLSESALRAPWTIRPAMTLLAQASRRSPEQAVGRMEASAGEADRPVFARPEIRVLLAQSMAETFRSGTRGAAHDLRLLAADWGLALDLVTADVDVWHGATGTQGASVNVRRLADDLPRCRLHEVAGAGHHVDLAAPERLLGALAG